MRRSRLPRIRLKALEEPDFVRDRAEQRRTGRTQRPSDAVGVVSLVPPLAETIAPVRGHARQRAHSGIEHQLGTPRPV